MDNDRKKRLGEGLIERLTPQLAAMEIEWQGHEIGINWEIDPDTHVVALTFGPVDHPEMAIRVVGVDVRQVLVGDGGVN
jgi:hypothetical protein